jgi:hypothetical protein
MTSSPTARAVSAPLVARYTRLMFVLITSALFGCQTVYVSASRQPHRYTSTSPQYQLNVIIDSNGLSSIYNSGQAVVIVRSVAAFVMTADAKTSGSGTPVGQPANSTQLGYLPVAWIEFQPNETNTIGWTNDYLMFASTTPLVAGATVAISSQSSACVRPGWLYTLSNGQFSSAQDNGFTYNAANMMSNSNLSFGLVQHATVNDYDILSPLNAAPTLYISRQYSGHLRRYIYFCRHM